MEWLKENMGTILILMTLWTGFWVLAEQIEQIEKHIGLIKIFLWENPNW